MVNKTLLSAVIGFLLGGLVVSVAAVTMGENDEPKNATAPISTVEHNQSATNKLKPLKGDEFDKAFMEEMLNHHQGAIDMAKLTETNGKHDELKQLGQAIISAQSSEISMMQAWQMEWGYVPATPNAHGARH